MGWDLSFHWNGFFKENGFFFFWRWTVLWETCNLSKKNQGFDTIYMSEVQYLIRAYWCFSGGSHLNILPFSQLLKHELYKSTSSYVCIRKPASLHLSSPKRPDSEGYCVIATSLMSVIDTRYLSGQAPHLESDTYCGLIFQWVCFKENKSHCYNGYVVYRGIFMMDLLVVITLHFLLS